MQDWNQYIHEALGGFSVRAGNGVSVHRSGAGLPVISCHGGAAVGGGGGGTYPRAGLPVARGGRFVFNLIPVRGAAMDPEASLPFANVKAYVKVLTLPVPYTIPGAPDTFGLGSMDVTSMGLVTVPHGVTPTRINATVSIADGSVTQGEYYFYCGKLFSDGRVLGFGSGDGTDDVDYFYPNISSFGWLPPPAAAGHYPEVNLV